jgi:tetratricopeptide (TPR) repeat protein
MSCPWPRKRALVTVAGPLTLFTLLAGCATQPGSFVPPEPALQNQAAAVSQQLRTHWELAKSRPDDANAVGAYGMTLQLYKQYASADACYRRAVDLDPTAFRWRYFLAVARHDDGRTREAIDALRGALAIDPTYAPAHRKMSEWLLLDGDLQGARASADEAVRQAPSSVRAHIALGKAIEAAEGAGNAVASYQKAAALAPLDAAAHYQLGMAYRDMGKPEEARAELTLHERYRNRISLEDDPLLRELQDLHAGADMWIRLGTSLLEQGDLQNAERFFRRASRLDGNALLAHANLIAVYGGMGRWSDAEAAYRAAAVDPGNWQAHFNYGILKIKREEYEPAEAALRMVIAANPKDVDAHVALAAALAKLNKTREAEGHYRQALDLQPESALANAMWGEHVLEAGRAEAAIEPLLRAALLPSANAPHARTLLTTAYAKVGGAGRSAAIVKRALDRAQGSASPALIEAVTAEWAQLQQGQIPR